MPKIRRTGVPRIVSGVYPRAAATAWSTVSTVPSIATRMVPETPTTSTASRSRTLVVFTAPLDSDSLTTPVRMAWPADSLFAISNEERSSNNSVVANRLMNFLGKVLALGSLNHCARFATFALEPLAPGWNLVTGDGQDAEAFVEDNACVTAVWTWDNTTLPNGTGFWRGYFPGDGTTFENGDTYGVIAQLAAGRLHSRHVGYRNRSAPHLQGRRG